MLKILYGYPSNEGYNNRNNLTQLRINHIERLVKAGFDIKAFDIGYSLKLPNLTFQQLDKFWKYKDKYLMALYDRFLRDIEDCDVFLNSVGINFHPEFIETISKYTVFGFNDDPESSSLLSKHIASSYDMCAIGNIAEIETYKSWGVKNVVWQPMGFSSTMYDPNLTYEDILHGNRDIDLSMIIDKLSKYRKERMCTLDVAFPNAHFYGRGWRKGFLPQGKEIDLLQRTKIGINIHNSTGPINTRLFYLPANGVLQICDNKSNLGKIYKLNEEVIGFDDINECIELCDYFLKHDDKRRLIAANGWKRVINEYNEISVFQRLIKNIELNISNKRYEFDIQSYSFSFKKTNQTIPFFLRNYLVYKKFIRSKFSVFRHRYHKFIRKICKK
jgi:hypothetical protein